MPTAPKPPKPPKDFVFDGDAGSCSIMVDPAPDGDGITLSISADDITIIHGKSGTRFAKEFYKFATKLLAYTSQGKLPKE